jgi:hypothetical protein
MNIRPAVAAGQRRKPHPIDVIIIIIIDVFSTLHSFIHSFIHQLVSTYLLIRKRTWSELQSSLSNLLFTEIRVQMLQTLFYFFSTYSNVHQ